MISPIELIDWLDPSWLSGVISKAVGWRSGSAELVRNPEVLGRMLALDAIVLNADRHEENILLAPTWDGGVEVFVIDNGNAEVGWPSGFEQKVDAVLDPKHLARGLPLERVRPFAMETAAKAEGPSVDALHDDVVAVCPLLGETKIEALLRTLALRCQAAPSLVSRYLDAIGSRP